ncbi:MAG: nitroreductase family deazaflavin-dependent oxidoreductase [Thermomicrobiales bacterium]
MAKNYRVTFGVRMSNVIVTALLRTGIKLPAPGGFGEMTLLTVRGRKSGVPRTVPVVMGAQGGKRWLVSPFGEVNWARNLRAAGEGIVTRGRRSEAIAVVELSASEAAPVLKQLLVGGAPSLVRSYFEVTASSPLDDFEREAPRHPVFLVRHGAGS